ncbi:MAG: gliding motility-associated C-terminal domain-containing protein [Saprospiraceae bacterium]
MQGSRPMTITTHLDFLDCMPEDDDPLAYEVTANTLQALTPKLEVLAFNFDLTSFNNQLEFDFQLGNSRTMAGAQTSDIAPNTWLYVTSATGLVTDFQLVDPTTGMAIPSVNGVFQIGNFPVDSVAYRLLGTNNSCEKEAFTIHYGWNCDPFTSQVQTPCYVRERVVNITSPPGEIDFLVDSPSGCFDLCETIPPYSLEIFNGELGSVYALTANAQMPPGQTIVPGSSQVEYPTGSGNFFPIADPVLINSTLAEWYLSAFDSLANGLPGINAAPANSITLIFETTTECGFIADAFTLFTIAAEQNCGDASNRVAKTADPICINGISQPYSTNIDVETETDFGCADEMVFEFSMTASATLPAGACVIVTLPQGITYVPNSCNSVCQNNFNCTPTIDGNTYTWQLPEGVASNQIVCFTFNTSGWSEFGCEDGLVIFRTANETQALCAATGDMCSTKVNTGSQLFPYNIERPAFELENFEVFASQTSGNDQVNFSIDITNCGSQNEPPITVDFFLDTNGDGMGDQLVHTQNLVAILSNCQSETMTGSFALPPGNLCNLVAYINPEQCACSIDSALISVPITYQTAQSFTVCSGEPKDIGISPMTGFTYQWEPVDCLGNDNAATTTFSCVNDTPTPITYQFILAESDGDACIINNLLDVTVQPVPGIAFAQTPICAGEPANLFATDGTSFAWQGPGIADPTTQAQVVAPITTSTYSVMVVDEFDCVGTDSVTIEVNDLPLVDAGPDIFNCPGAATQLNATFNPAWDYLWSPAVIGGLPTLSDPTIHNPNVITTENVTYTLLVTDANGCTATDQIFVSVSGALNLIISPDITICLSSSTTLGVSGGDTYSWSGGDCLSPLCDSISVSPTVPTTYTVVASTMAGCLDSAMVTVTPTVENILTYDTLYRCAGDSALIHGMYEFVSDTYPDTMVLAGGCLGIDSVTLFVSDPPETVMVEGRICEGESFEFNGNFYTESDTDTLPTVSGCDSIIYQINIEVSMPTVEIQGDHTVSPDSSITLSIEPTTFDSIVWSTENMVLECDNDTLCEVFPIESIEYTVTVVDSLGCIAIDNHQVDVVIQCFPDQAQIPNVFTPNNDSINDEFTIVTKNDEQVLQMRIWDRWGKKVYDGTGPWDGMVNGKPAASDVYIYDILVGCPAGVEADENLLRGDVTLLR